MSQSNRPTVNLLCLSQENSLRYRSQSVAIALTQMGWQVNLFVRGRAVEAVSTSWISPHCQVVRLAITASVEDMAKAIETAQRKVGLVWPFLHSLDGLGAQVGAFIQATQGWRWLHTPELPGHKTEVNADQLISLTPASVSVTGLLTDEVSHLRRQRQRFMQDVNGEDWTEVARRLDRLYRQHLALHIGATEISLPKEVSIPLPVVVPEHNRVPAVQSA